MLTATLLCLVVGISDGDMLTARCPTQEAILPYQQIKVRLQGIDAPERKQPFDNHAREALSELRCNKLDRYKRHICSAWVTPASAPSDPRTHDAKASPPMKVGNIFKNYAKKEGLEARFTPCCALLHDSVTTSSPK